jgi:formylglycine-generating enzyme required for sulfatase activity
MKTITGIAFVVLALCCGSRIAAVTIDMVTIRNAGNAPDTWYGDSFGSVDYVYRMGKYEITAEQYTEFLNAVADTDTYGLYKAAMGNPGVGQGANIQRTGSAPNYSYSVPADWADRPVNFTTIWDAARFVNWLHNGQPTGPQGPGTTETGAYLNVGNQATFARHADAKFFLPTIDEWYKAAYHDKSAGIAANYFDYPTGINIAPGVDLTETSNPGNNANYFTSTYAIGSPYYRTVVGEFELSDSPYGTFDQGGNVGEWTETANTGSSRTLSGGGFDNPWSVLIASTGHYSTDPMNENSSVGFRVAGVVPEPNTVLLGVLACAGIVVRRRR